MRNWWVPNLSTWRGNSRLAGQTLVPLEIIELEFPEYLKSNLAGSFPVNYNEDNESYWMVNPGAAGCT